MVKLDKTDRIAALSEALGRAFEAKALSGTYAWTNAWEKFERELLQRLLECGPTDDEARYRLQIAIEASRQVRRVIEHEGRTTGDLETQIAVLTGEKTLRIA